jgi:hypothetical protein
MNVLTETWRQLVRRRLWPVAVLLVAALVAVPVVLAKPATPVPSTPATAAAAAPVATPAQSYVKLASDDKPAKRRRVLGEVHDPFEPAALPKASHHKKAAKQAVTAQATATATPAASGSGSGSAVDTGGAVPVAVPVPTAAPAPVKHVAANSVDVKFGKTDGDLAKSTLQRDDTLPASSPLIVFMGFRKGGKVAEFMLTGTVTAEGDGSCSPSTQGCETLLLHKGETEFLTFSGTSQDGQYELDVKDLHPTS